MVGEEPATDPPALVGPDERRRRRTGRGRGSGRSTAPARRSPTRCSCVVVPPDARPHVHVAAEDHRLVRLVRALRRTSRRGGTARRRARVVTWRLATRPEVGEAHGLADAALAFAAPADRERARAPRRAAPARRAIAFAWPVTTDRRRPWCSSVIELSERGADQPRPCRDRADRRHPAPAPRGARAPRRAPPAGRARPGASAVAKANHLLEVRLPLRRHGVAVKEVPRADEERHARSLRLQMRVLLADPPAFTPTYDHELAASLARAGADVELVTSRFRFGEVPAARRVRAHASSSTRSRRGSSAARACGCR